MFTGLVQCMAEVVELLFEGNGCNLSVKPELKLPVPEIGDSIAVNGCCLTVTKIDGAVPTWTFQAGEETLKRTNLGKLKSGSLVNLETSMCLGDKIGGHLVTGHIDGQGTLAKCEIDDPWRKLWFTVPQNLARQMASKGSVAVDGVSLTLVDVTESGFSVALIPHTLAETTMGRLEIGGTVNIETDVLAKYVQRQLEFLPSQS